MIKNLLRATSLQSAAWKKQSKRITLMENPVKRYTCRARRSESAYISIIFCVLHTNVSYHWQYGERLQKTFILNYLLDQVPLELNRFLDLESLSHQNFVLVKNLLKSQEFHWILSTDACIAFAQQVVFEMGAYLRVDGSYWNSCKLIPW